MKCARADFEATALLKTARMKLVGGSWEEDQWGQTHW
jgi:hypothetical protein